MYTKIYLGLDGPEGNLMADEHFYGRMINNNYCTDNKEEMRSVCFLVPNPDLPYGRSGQSRFSTRDLQISSPTLYNHCTQPSLPP